MNYKLKNNALGFLAGTIFKPTTGGKGYIAYYDDKNYATFPKHIVDGSSDFEPIEDKVWNKDWKPDRDEKYYYVDSLGHFFINNFDNDEIDKSRIKFGNCFKTRYEAEMWRKRLEAIAVKQTYEEGETFYYYDFQVGVVIPSTNYVYQCERKKFKTQKEALEFGRKYRDAILFFNK